MCRGRGGCAKGHQSEGLFRLNLDHFDAREDEFSQPVPTPREAGYPDSCALAPQGRAGRTATRELARAWSQQRVHLKNVMSSDTVLEGCVAGTCTVQVPALENRWKGGS